MAKKKEAVSDANTKEIMGLLERELDEFKASGPLDEIAILAFGLRMFTHGYGHAKLTISRTGGRA